MQKRFVLCLLVLPIFSCPFSNLSCIQNSIQFQSSNQKPMLFLHYCWNSSVHIETMGKEEERVSFSDYQTLAVSFWAVSALSQHCFVPSWLSKAQTGTPCCHTELVSSFSSLFCQCKFLFSTHCL